MSYLVGVLSISSLDTIAVIVIACLWGATAPRFYCCGRVDMSKRIQLRPDYKAQSEKLRAPGAMFMILLAVGACCMAQPTQVSYQGELRKDGGYYNGVAQMKFAIVDGGATLWSNDGSSTNGSEPATAAAVNVFRGIFTTQLGQAPEMTPLDAAAISNATSPALRVWVRTDPGPGAFEQLSPDQTVSSSVFALRSASPWAKNGSHIQNTNTGNVGIGIIGPSEKLTVLGGKIYASGQGPLSGFQFDHLALFQDTNQTLKLTSAGDYNVALIPEGNVGIGTATPTRKLDVLGDSRITGQLLISSSSPSSAKAFSVDQLSTTDIADFRQSGDVKVVISNAGNVGIGTTNPTEKFSVVDGRINPSGTGTNSGIQFSHLHLYEDDDQTLKLTSAGGYNVAIVNQGNVGIGTTTPNSKLSVERFDGPVAHFFGENHTATDTATRVGIADQTGGVTWLLSANNNGTFAIHHGGVGDYLTVTNGSGNVGVGTTAPTHKLHVNGTARVSALITDGNTQTACLSITGGCDIAEPFEVSRDEGTESEIQVPKPQIAIEPGMLVSIDRKQAGKIRLSGAAYDTTVVGVVSGAGGVNTGMTLSQQGTFDSGVPVALTGRVYCWCDASYGAIQPGDLLTTSATPGHAMKVDDKWRAGGAMIGKALSSLESGRGLVLIVVSLQ
ncbi:MAG: hypothetical protein JNG88_10915 [Phycisphaerales bacterium]|nr:hypothetical protein [Phycisphaerales bacterium]